MILENGQEIALFLSLRYNAFAKIIIFYIKHLRSLANE